jgi:cytidylate kinase
MRIICVSRGSHGYGIDLAQRLAAQLGYACIARETLTDDATADGIPVGRIEAAIVKRRPLSEDLEIQVDRFKAFVTAALCKKAMTSDGVVYHGRSGHLVLPGVGHVFRVRAIATPEERITMAMARMNISRDKAKEYISQVEEDRRRWVRLLYNVDWDDPSLYDVVINTQHLSVANAAAGLVHLAQLPEYQPTPASRQALEDLLLAARCRLEIGRDPRTAPVKAAVKAEKRRVSVTYLPRQAAQAAVIPDVIAGVDGIESLVCTVATTNILFLQEAFDPRSEALDNLIRVAEKWNAAVEIVRLRHGERPAAQSAGLESAAPARREYDGGILDDERTVPAAEEDAGLAETIDRLIQAGRAGGSRTIYGGATELVGSLHRSGNYSLIVVGDLFLPQQESVRKRMTRDLINLLSDKLRVPIIESAALKNRYLFGARQLASMAACALVAASIYVAVFRYEVPVLGFLTSSSTTTRLAAAAVVGVLVPVVAYSLGGFYHNVLRLIRIE